MRERERKRERAREREAKSVGDNDSDKEGEKERERPMSHDAWFSPSLPRERVCLHIYHPQSERCE